MEAIWPGFTRLLALFESPFGFVKRPVYIVIPGKDDSTLGNEAIVEPGATGDRHAFQVINYHDHTVAFEHNIGNGRQPTSLPNLQCRISSVLS